MIKILTVTDIHDAVTPFQHTVSEVNPDLILDCGDHETLEKLAGNVPHYYVNGNHEPALIVIGPSDIALPHRIHSNEVYLFEGNNDSTLVFSGIGGNYSSKSGDLSVRNSDVKNLEQIAPKNLDILLLHESPFGLSELERENHPLAQEVIDQIARIRPKYVLSGHTGFYSEQTIGETRVINLPDMEKGYGILTLDKDKFSFKKFDRHW